MSGNRQGEGMGKRVSMEETGEHGNSTEVSTVGW